MTDNQNKIVQAIRSRQTVKVIADDREMSSFNSGALELSQIDEIIATAGWAPFHHPSHQTHRADNKKMVEPWRVYKLDGSTCNKLVSMFEIEDNPGKLSGMLGAADALLNVTWLPDPDPAYKAPEFKPSERNMEHIAATSAFIQNILTIATSEGISSYWSSGGALNLPKYKKLLGIKEEEILLGAIFLFPENKDAYDVRVGKWRENRSDQENWSTWVKL